MNEMYSIEWFETFATTVAASITETELSGIGAVMPRDQYPRILDVGCGIGRIAGSLFSRGYAVTGLDINVEALVNARRSTSGPRYIALDQKHVGRMRWEFDGAIFLWNSIGFVGRGTDLETMTGLSEVLRPGGKVALDLYHPDWLQRNERAGETDLRGALVRRWMRHGRCFNEIRYANGRVDNIQFDVYQPEEMSALMSRAGFQPGVPMEWWNPQSLPHGDSPRYQLVGVRR